MPSQYLDQPILSSRAVSAFLEQNGVDFEAWPQSVLPDEMLELMDAGTDQDMEMLLRYNASFDGPAEEYRAALIAHNHAPRALLRTTWGILIGGKVEGGTSRAVAGTAYVGYSVKIEPSKGWYQGILGAYADTCMDLLNADLEEFLAQNRNTDIQLGFGVGDGILELTTFTVPSDGEGAEESAATALTKYLVKIFADGTLEKVIASGSRGELIETGTNGTVVGKSHGLR